jgi:hypothetical protein
LRQNRGEKRGEGEQRDRGGKCDLGGVGVAGPAAPPAAGEAEARRERNSDAMRPGGA